MKKTLIAVVLTLVVCLCAFGTTLAFLMDKTDPVVNTFTVGNVDITLTETGATAGTGNLIQSFKMVPGSDIAKDPKVTVVGGSEACYLFVKIDESTNLDDFITYAVATGWTELEAGVYYRNVAAAAENQEFSVLEGNKVTVNDTVTKTQMDAITANTADAPTLTFTAYAVQAENVVSPAAAWAIANP